MDDNVVVITSKGKIRPARVRFTRDQVLRAARRAAIVAEAKKQLALGNYY